MEEVESKLARRHTADQKEKETRWRDRKVIELIMLIPQRKENECKVNEDILPITTTERDSKSD